MSTILRSFVVIGAVLLVVSGGAFAERQAAAPVTGETVNLFGVAYTVNGIQTTSTAFLGAGALTIDCGMGLGYREGASPAQDRIFLTDECGAGGEDIQMLTGIDPVTFAPTAAASTSSYIVNNTGGSSDPAGIEWINDTNTGPNSDPNYRFPHNWTGGSQWALWAVDADGIPFADFNTLSDNDSAPDAYVGMGMCKNALDDTATRLYWGGVDRDGSDNPHFAYTAFDLTSNSFVSNHSVFLDGMGTPDDNSTAYLYERSLRAMGYDGTYYYVMAKKPGVAEAWLYRFNSLPDPSPSADTVHPDTPLSAQLDNAAGGVAWPMTTTVSQAGLTFGRLVNGNRVMYVLCDEYLYTLVPQPADVDNWKKF